VVGHEAVPQADLHVTINNEDADIYPLNDEVGQIDIGLSVGQGEIEF